MADVAPVVDVAVPFTLVKLLLVTKYPVLILAAITPPMVFPFIV